MYEGMFEDWVKGVITTIVAVGVIGVIGGYALSSRNTPKAEQKAVINQATWIADHHELYGNKNGVLDLDEQIGISKEVNNNQLVNDLDYTTAKAYVDLYKNSTVMRTNR